MMEMTTGESLRMIAEAEERQREMMESIRDMDKAAERWAAEMYCPAIGEACKTNGCWAFGGVKQTPYGHVTVSCHQYGEKVYNEGVRPEWL